MKLLPKLLLSPETSARRRLAARVPASTWLLTLCAVCVTAAAAPVASVVAPPAAAYRGDRILIQPKPGTSQATLLSLHSAQHCEVLRNFEAMGGPQILSLPAGETVEHCLARYQQSGLVQFAEPDYLRQLAATPNDPAYTNGTLWGLNNYGQNGGSPGADIDAPEGWDVLTSASNIVVAVLDSGVRYTHEDLAANMWVNPTDGGHGWNALTWTNDPADDNGHGTWMAGVLGAVGDNGKGVVGVAWKVQIMACKCFNSAGLGSDSDIIACVYYAMFNGARVINASLGSYAYSQSLSNAIRTAARSGIIVVAAAGGDPAVNVDVQPYYPACYQLDNVVSVAYTTRNDLFGTKSNYGATNVDLAAPGKDIYTTAFNSDNAYLGSPFLEGTSYASAYVSGAVALMLAKYPAESYQQIISRLLNATDPLPALAGQCATGGRLDLRKALSPPISLTLLSGPTNGPMQLRVSAGPNRACVIQAAPDLVGWSPVFTNTTSSAGTFDYTDNQSTNLARRFYRAVSSL
jgi:subtilisin family serine protease